MLSSRMLTDRAVRLFAATPLVMGVVVFWEYMTDAPTAPALRFGGPVPSGYVKCWLFLMCFGAYFYTLIERWNSVGKGGSKWPRWRLAVNSALMGLAWASMALLMIFWKYR